MGPLNDSSRQPGRVWQWLGKRPDFVALSLWLLCGTLLGYHRLAKDWCADRTASVLPLESGVMLKYPCNGSSLARSLHIMTHPIQVYQDLLWNSPAPIRWVQGQILGVMTRFAAVVLLPPAIYRRANPWLIAAARTVAPVCLVLVAWQPEVSPHVFDTPGASASSAARDASAACEAPDLFGRDQALMADALAVPHKATQRPGEEYIDFSLRWYPLMDVAFNLIHPTSILVERLYAVLSIACVLFLGLRPPGFRTHKSFRLPLQLAKCVASTAVLLSVETWRHQASLSRQRQRKQPWLRCCQPRDLGQSAGAGSGAIECSSKASSTSRAGNSTNSSGDVKCDSGSSSSSKAIRVAALVGSEACVNASCSPGGANDDARAAEKPLRGEGGRGGGGLASAAAAQEGCFAPASVRPARPLAPGHAVAQEAGGVDEPFSSNAGPGAAPDPGVQGPRRPNQAVTPATESAETSGATPPGTAVTASASTVASAVFRQRRGPHRRGLPRISVVEMYRLGGSTAGGGGLGARSVGSSSSGGEGCVGGSSSDARPSRLGFRGLQQRLRALSQAWRLQLGQRQQELEQPQPWQLPAIPSMPLLSPQVQSHPQAGQPPFPPYRQYSQNPQRQVQDQNRDHARFGIHGMGWPDPRQRLDGGPQPEELDNIHNGDNHQHYRGQLHHNNEAYLWAVPLQPLPPHSLPARNLQLQPQPPVGQLRHRFHVPYSARSALYSTRIKIEGFEPDQIAGGYVERIERVVSTAGMQLEGVTVRPGCIELLVETRSIDAQGGQELGSPPASLEPWNSGGNGGSSSNSAALHEQVQAPSPEPVAPPRALGGMPYARSDSATGSAGRGGSSFAASGCDEMLDIGALIRALQLPDSTLDTDLQPASDEDCDGCSAGAGNGAARLAATASRLRMASGAEQDLGWAAAEVLNEWLMRGQGSSTHGDGASIGSAEEPAGIPLAADASSSRGGRATQADASSSRGGPATQADASSSRGGRATQAGPMQCSLDSVEHSPLHLALSRPVLLPFVLDVYPRVLCITGQVEGAADSTNATATAAGTTAAEATALPGPGVGLPGAQPPQAYPATLTLVVSWMQSPDSPVGSMCRQLPPVVHAALAADLTLMPGSNAAAAVGGRGAQGAEGSAAAVAATAPVGGTPGVQTHATASGLRGCCGAPPPASACRLNGNAESAFSTTGQPGALQRPVESTMPGAEATLTAAMAPPHLPGARILLRSQGGATEVVFLAPSVPQPAEASATVCSGVDDTSGHSSAGSESDALAPWEMYSSSTVTTTTTTTAPAAVAIRSAPSESERAASEGGCGGAALGGGAELGSEAVYSLNVGPVLPQLRCGVMLVEARPAAETQPILEAAAAALSAHGPFVVPVLLVDDPSVAEELQATADNWCGTVDELDDLLYDIGALLEMQDKLVAPDMAGQAAAAVGEGSTMGAVAACGGCRPAAAPATTLMQRTATLYEHVMAYAGVMCWQSIQRWLQSRQVRAAGPSTVAPTATASTSTMAGALAATAPAAPEALEAGPESSCRNSQLGTLGTSPLPPDAPSLAAADAAGVEDDSCTAGHPTPGSFGSPFGVGAGARSQLGSGLVDAGCWDRGLPEGRAEGYGASRPAAALLSSAAPSAALPSRPPTAAWTPRPHAWSPATAPPDGYTTARSVSLYTAMGYHGGHRWVVWPRLLAQVLRRLWELLVVVLGVRRMPAEEAKSYRAFVADFAAGLMNVMQALDMLAVAAVFGRSGGWFNTDKACVLVAGSVGVVMAFMWMLLPGTTWRRLSAGAKWPRQVSYTVAKVMVALLGFPQPPATVRHELSSSMFVVEGIILPAAVLMSPLEAAVVGLIRAPLCARMWALARGPYGPLAASLRALRLTGMAVLTTLVIHMYIRMSFERRRSRSLALRPKA